MPKTVYPKRITSSKYDEILRKRDEWDQNYNRLESERRSQEHEYRAAIEAIKEGIQKPLENYLNSNFQPNIFKVSMGISWRDSGFDCSVKCNDWSHDENIALRWNFDVEITEDGEVKISTGSWSGLQAVTPAQMDSLESSIRAIKYLHSVRWSALLKRALPQYRDYVTTDVPSKGQRPNFEAELAEEVLDSIVGKRKAIYGNAVTATGYNPEYSSGYYILFNSTGKTYTAAYVPCRREADKEDAFQRLASIFDAGADSYYAFRVRKSSLIGRVDPDKVEDF